MQYAGIHEQIIKAYGFAALAWKIILCFVLSIAAANLISGLGLILALVAAALWLALPTLQLLRFLAIGSEFEIPNRRRFARVSGGLVIGLLAVLFFLPAPSIMNVPIVVDYQPLSIVRAETPGFIDEILVDDQQPVHQGDVLMRLRNDDLEVQLLQTRTELQKANIRARSA